ncbi:hypothetical protein B1R94_25905 [Mycolicibacterium litorale]|nr:hypothetical protein B1R94_25905 [Mycolicibacterium litorale]
MSGFTTYFTNKIMGHVFCGQSWTPPSTYYWALHIGEPTDLGTANPSVITARVPSTLSVPDAAGMVMITADLSWLETAPEPISHLSGWDAATGGHCCFIKQLEKSRNFYDGDTIVVPKFGIQLAAGVDITELGSAA